MPDSPTTEIRWLRHMVERAYRDGYSDGCCQPKMWPTYDDDAWNRSGIKAELENPPKTENDLLMDIEDGA